MRTTTKVFLGSTLALGMAAAAVATAVRAQEEAPGAAPAPAPAPAPTEDWAALVKGLGSDDPATRRAAWDALRKGGEAARPALREAAESADPQLRFAARRLLAAETPAGPALGAARPRRVLRFSEEAGEAPVAPRRVEVDLGKPPVAAPEPPADLRKAVEEIRRRLEELERGGAPSPFAFEGALRDPAFLHPGWFPGGEAKGEQVVTMVEDGLRTEVRVGADGKVKATVSKPGPDGKPVEETFEAADLEAFAKAHPEIHGRVRGLLGAGGARGLWTRLPGLAPDRGGPAPGDAEGPVLGVLLAPVPEVLRSHCSLPGGEGQVVEEVLPGTLAASLGLRVHDVLLEVNGLPVSTPEEVRGAVAAVPKGRPVLLRVLRGGKAQDLSGTR